jgi:two-component system sensor histidine kinase DegS
MKKIQKFFQTELETCNEKKSRIENEIHRANLDIQFVIKTRKKIISESDDTSHIFYANGNDSTFNNREISSLRLKEDKLKNLIAVRTDELGDVQKRIDYIHDMISECDQFNYKVNSSHSETDILQIQEAERQRIARDIHDSIVQNLTVLVHKSEFAMKVIDSDTLRTKLELGVINKIVKDCIKELREIIADLRPMSLDDLGLEVTLKRKIAEIDNSTDMNIKLNYYIEDNININPTISVTILRIIQELSSNAIKYSQGKNIFIDISNSENNLYICFEDDGIGFTEFDNKSILNNKNSGFGLPILKERIHLLSGNIKVDKNKNNTGTRYHIEIPLNYEER